jgi:hypothetical protein
VQALDIGAQRSLGSGVVGHKRQRTPRAGGRSKADATAALGAKVWEYGARDIHMSKEVYLKEVIDVYITIIPG